MIFDVELASKVSVLLLSSQGDQASESGISGKKLTDRQRRHLSAHIQMHSASVVT
jgi:hypothetical protein